MNDTSSSHPLIPVMVVGGGRSGTTLLMQLLGSAPDVWFEDVYPLERRYLTYLVHHAHIPIDAAGGRDAGSVAAETVDALGPLPWESAIDVSWLAPEPQGLAFTWRHFSEAVRAASPSARFYAEKTPPWAASAVRAELAPTKSLIPIRDPRDVFLSIVSFTGDRSGAGFGMRPDDTPTSFARRFARGQARRLQGIIDTPESESVTVVRYEQLIAELDAEAGRLSAFLGTRLDPDVVRRRRAELGHHMTSRDPAASVARWKREMGPRTREIFSEAMSTQLGALGYDG